MLKKLVILGSSALLLGGCSLPNFLNMGNAAKDTKSLYGEENPAPTVTTTPDAELQTMPSTSPKNDDQSLETDINNTNVVQEDFSNLN